MHRLILQIEINLTENFNVKDRKTIEHVLSKIWQSEYFFAKFQQTKHTPDLVGIRYVHLHARLLITFSIEIH